VCGGGDERGFMITVPNCAKEEGVKGVGEIREGVVIWICFAMMGGVVGFFFGGDRFLVFVS